MSETHEPGENEYRVFWPETLDWEPFAAFPTAARLFEQMIKSETFDEFLTLPAYELLS